MADSSYELYSSWVGAGAMANKFRVRKNFRHVRKTEDGPVRTALGDVPDAFLGDAHHPLTSSKATRQLKRGRNHTGSERAPILRGHEAKVPSSGRGPVTAPTHGGAVSRVLDAGEMMEGRR